MKPNKKADLIIERLHDEIIIYDPITLNVHCLNGTAAFIWQLCNGDNSVEDIIRMAEDNVTHPIKEDVVWLALGKLQSAGLVEDVPVELPELSRREAIQGITRTGVAASASILLPTVITTSLPQPAAAQSVVTQVVTNVVTNVIVVVVVVVVGFVLSSSSSYEVDDVTTKEIVAKIFQSSDREQRMATIITLLDHIKNVPIPIYATRKGSDRGD
jgi:hypothetical protein